MKHYGAKLLFQFRTRRNGNDNAMRVCEERVVRFAARSDSSAEAKVRRYGIAEEWTDESADGDTVHFEFVGIIDIKDGLDPLPGDDGKIVEVWYELRERLRPMERKATLLPDSSNYSMRGGSLHGGQLTVYR